MRKTISIYWPLAIIVPLAAAAYLHTVNGAQPREPLAAYQASAELARAVSFGLVATAPRAAAVAPLATAKAL